MWILFISGWLVAIPIVVVSVVPFVVFPAQCALMGAMGGALYGMWRLGKVACTGYVPPWRELVLPVLRPILGSVAGWVGLIALSLLLRIVANGEVEVRSETAWCVSFMLGLLTDPICRRFERDRSPRPSLQDGENRYNNPSL